MATPTLPEARAYPSAMCAALARADQHVPIG